MKTKKYYDENPRAYDKKKKYDKEYHSTEERKKYRAFLNKKNRQVKIKLLESVGKAPY